MCGIAGLWQNKSDIQPLADRVQAMTATIHHRGPDDSGIWVNPHGQLALGHRRLSIIDLSAGGHQPMVSPRGSVIVFNGEIYNYRALRTRFEGEGAVFKSQSDTEVLLYGLDHYGVDILPLLDAQYAFAWWHPERQELLLARDPFGEKPLYYTTTSQYFGFASELHALASLPDFDAGITLDSIATYLALQYLPSPQTIYRGAHKLSPGHYLLRRADGSQIIKQHYTFRTSVAMRSTQTLAARADALEEILTDSVSTRMISDVPLGAFLSGGVDSGIVCALARKKLGIPLQTFSIGFAGTPDSEHEAAAATAVHLGTQHRQEIIQLDALPLGADITRALDEPNGDTSCLPVWLLSRLAKRHVTVALSGDGGDEMFGGYNRYFSTLRDEVTHGQDNDWSPGWHYYSGRLLVFRDDAIEKFLGHIPDGLKIWLTARRDELKNDPRPLINKMREQDALHYMPGAVLAKVDRMSMQHALEVRAPLLGRKIADFAMTLAADECYADGQGKLVLKELAARYLPRDWLQRPKMGFGLPVTGWDASALATATTSLLLDKDCRLQQWINVEKLRKFCNYHARQPHLYQLWCIYMLEHWLRQHPHQVA
jgi:asparagine synthase (glutamine-hydrolysing)